LLYLLILKRSGNLLLFYETTLQVLVMESVVVLGFGGAGFRLGRHGGQESGSGNGAACLALDRPDSGSFIGTDKT
jgi:hypothetical protein